MLKKLFGPFPDEPLLYSFDKILGLFHIIDFKLKRNIASNNGTNVTNIVVPIIEEIVDVIVETTTENVVTSTTSTQGVSFFA